MSLYVICYGLITVQKLQKNENPDCIFLHTPGPEVIKLPTQLSMKFIFLLNVKTPTIVGVLTFISMINTTSERLKARNFFICRYFSFYERLKFRAQLS